MQTLVSIITPNYNTENYLPNTIESVIQQSYPYWELIIVDDASSDSSCEIIEAYCNKDKRIRLIAQKSNKGPAKCRNIGIRNAKGSFMTFIDSDDLWKVDFLKESLNFIPKSEGFVFASYHRYDEDLNPKYKDFIVPKKVSYSDILKTNSISCLTAFIDIQKLGKLEMPNILYRQDMGLWLKYLKKIDFAYGIPQPLAIYRIRKKSHSRNKIKLLKHQWNFYRNNASLSLIMTMYYFSMWILLGIKKYYL